MVERDLEQASERDARHIFAIGHKPAYPWPGAPTDGLVMYEVRDNFWTSMENSEAEAMFSAHNHVCWKQQPNEGGTWQIIAGMQSSNVTESCTPKATLETPRLGREPASLSRATFGKAGR